jgi:hypothetical protein
MSPNSHYLILVMLYFAIFCIAAIVLNSNTVILTLLGGIVAMVLYLWAVYLNRNR